MNPTASTMLATNLSFLGVMKKTFPGLSVTSSSEFWVQNSWRVSWPYYFRPTMPNSIFLAHTFFSQIQIFSPSWEIFEIPAVVILLWKDEVWWRLPHSLSDMYVSDSAMGLRLNSTGSNLFLNTFVLFLLLLKKPVFMQTPTPTCRLEMHFRNFFLHIAENCFFPLVKWSQSWSVTEQLFNSFITKLLREGSEKYSFHM